MSSNTILSNGRRKVNTTPHYDQYSNQTGKPISFSFAGCGFLGLYHVGVASCLREYAPISKNTRIGGASAGALAAMALACDLPLGESTSEILHVAIKARSRALGPFHPSFDVNKIIYDGLVKTLPDDAHLKANGRLFISVTRISDGKNVIIDKFKSKEELIKAIQCSCFIPLWSGLVPPKFNGIAYIDGGCSDNLPIIDENTVTISPFAGESDICPQDDTYNLFQVNLANTSIALTPANLYRLTRILFPAHPEVLSKMCQQGFDDALRYLQRNNKISCTRCLAFHFTLEKEDNDEEVEPGSNGIGFEKETLMDKKLLRSKHQHPDRHSLENCRDCEYRRQIAGFDSLPESVVQAIQEACDQVNKGLINWIFRHRPMKLLSILSIPYLLPIDITIAICTKLYERLPDIKRELKNSLLQLVSFLRSLLVKMESNRYFYSAKFSCQLAVKEFDYSKEENLKARKLSNTLTRKKSLQQKASKVEKANSFSGRKSSMADTAKPAVMMTPERELGVRSLESVIHPVPPIHQIEQPYLSPNRVQRSVSDNEHHSKSAERYRKTSYAGRESARANTNVSRQVSRRRSMIEMGDNTSNPSIVLPPERVISQLNFDFKLDMKNSKSNLTADSMDSVFSEKATSVTSDSKVLDIDLSDIDQTNAIEIANKALDWEKQLLEKCKGFKGSDGNFDKMFEITRHQDAVMAYYYTDENNKVKFTELFNITDHDMKNLDAAMPGDETLVDEYDQQNDEPLITYNDSDDGLIEPPLAHLAKLAAASHSMSPSLSDNGKSPLKRQRKKSALVD